MTGTPLTRRVPVKVLGANGTLQHTAYLEFDAFDPVKSYHSIDNVVRDSSKKKKKKRQQEPSAHEKRRDSYFL